MAPARPDCFLSGSDRINGIRIITYVVAVARAGSGLILATTSGEATGHFRIRRATLDPDARSPPAQTFRSLPGSAMRYTARLARGGVVKREGDENGNDQAYRADLGRDHYRHIG